MLSKKELSKLRELAEKAKYPDLGNLVASDSERVMTVRNECFDFSAVVSPYVMISLLDSIQTLTDALEFIHDRGEGLSVGLLRDISGKALGEVYVTEEK